MDRGGCNRLTGGYELNGDQLKLSQMAGNVAPQACRYLFLWCKICSGRLMKSSDFTQCPVN